MMNGLSASDGPCERIAQLAPGVVHEHIVERRARTPSDSTVTPRSAAAVSTAPVVAAPACDVSRNCDPSPVTLSTPGKPREPSAPVGRHAGEAHLDAFATPDTAALRRSGESSAISLP